MKTPLRYQITEFDCGTVSLINCVAYLFDREDIPAELIKAIHTYTLDCYDDKGNLGEGGTSREAVKFLSRWLTSYSETKDFGVKCTYLSGKDVTLEQIKHCIKNGGCVNFRTYQEVEHYVTITGIDDSYLYIFDPYFQDVNTYVNDRYIYLIDNEPFKYNRKVSIDRFLSNKRLECALGPINKRECVLFRKK